MVPDDSNSQIGIKLVANQIYLLEVTEISKTKCSEGCVICLTLLAIRGRCLS